MPIQKADRATQWNITENDQTWTLAKEAHIDVVNQNGIFEGGFSNSTIEVFGDITVTGNFSAVRLNSTESTVILAKSSHVDIVDGRTGIFIEGVGAGADVLNRGSIEGGFTGIFAGASADVKNYGTIKSATAMDFDGAGSHVENFGKIKGTESGIVSGASGTVIENAKGALISGNLYAVYLGESGDAEVTNHGKIRSSGSAIQTTGGDDNIVNRGTVVGSIQTSSGEDIIDTRGGIVTGQIMGGDDGDTYKISNAKIDIFEYDNGGGTDEVQTTVSYKLAANVETLRLIGKDDINGVGNELGNTVNGNKGDNHLSGKAGVDYLNGGRGDDLLTGGSDADVFLFQRTDGKDVINDFEDGMDRLYIDRVYNQATFDELDIRQAKGDVIIDFGDGNQIRIEEMTKANFTFEDIILLA